MIYLDNAATTKPYPEAVDAMMDTLTELYGNPSAIYSLGSGAKKRVNLAKRTIAAGERSRTTGHCAVCVRPMETEGNISSQPGSSTMPYCIPASMWKDRALR